jgi:hypothetical protein
MTIKMKVNVGSGVRSCAVNAEREVEERFV